MMNCFLPEQSWTTPSEPSPMNQCTSQLQRYCSGVAGFSPTARLFCFHSFSLSLFNAQPLSLLSLGLWQSVSVFLQPWGDIAVFHAIELSGIGFMDGFVVTKYCPAALWIDASKMQGSNGLCRCLLAGIIPACIALPASANTEINSLNGKGKHSGRAELKWVFVHVYIVLPSVLLGWQLQMS